MNKAPKGGLTSAVNGQFYDGGEFMPEHGLFCGKRGATRAKKVEKAKLTGKFVNLGGAKLFEVFQRDEKQSHVSYLVATVVADTHGQAKAAVNLPRTTTNEI